MPNKPPTTNCLNCSKEIKQYKGRKLKKYCDDGCRSAYWNREYGARKNPQQKILAVDLIKKYKNLSDEQVEDLLRIA